MNRDRWGVVLSAAVLLVGCGSPVAGGAGCNTGTCALPDAGGSCAVASTLVTCTLDGGSSTQLASVDQCNAAGAQCSNVCGEGEFAAACGGPPHPLPDGGLVEPSSAPPAANCISVGGINPGGGQSYCCPCG